MGEKAVLDGEARSEAAQKPDLPIREPRSKPIRELSSRAAVPEIMISPDARCAAPYEKLDGFAKLLAAAVNITKNDNAINALSFKLRQCRAKVIDVLVDVGEDSEFHDSSVGPNSHPILFGGLVTPPTDEDTVAYTTRRQNKRLIIESRQFLQTFQKFLRTGCFGWDDTATRRASEKPKHVVE